MSEYFVNTAILHVFDYTSNNVILSQQSLNLEDEVVEGYVNKQVQRIMNDMRRKDGFFHEESTFLKLVEAYKNREFNFVDLSLKVSQMLQEYLKNTDAQAYDILFADYLYDDVPYISFMLLENQMAFTHLTHEENGFINNTIIQQRSLLPSPSKKINTFACINTVTNEILFTDDINWNSSDVKVIQDMILDCTCERSKQEVLKEVQEVIEEVAEKTDVNPTILLSKYKNYMQENMEEETPVSTEDLAAEVFSETEELQNAFISASVEHELPKQVELPKQFTRKMKSQKIKTDTGIELTFPTEYSDDNRYIEFINNPDGTVSIEIKHVTKITNKG